MSDRYPIEVKVVGGGDEPLVIQWRLEPGYEGVGADWYDILQDVDFAVRDGRTCAPEVVAAWQHACDAGRGPDADAGEGGWRTVELDD